MLLEIRQKANSYGKELVLCCDQCSKEFVKNYKESIRNRKHHFCNMKCSGDASKAGNILAKERIKTLKKIYDINPAIEIINISQIYAIKERKKETCMKKYNVPCSFLVKDKNGIEKRVKTSLKRWKTKYPMQSKEVQKILADVIIKNNGGLGFASKSIYEAFTKKMLETYGVSHPMHSELIRAKFDWQKWRQQIHEIMKKNNTFGKSKPEDECYKYLCTIYGNNNVERFVRVNKWSIDFCISNIFNQNIYIQLDGIYWHGLSRSLIKIKEAAENGSAQAIGIYKSYFKDIKQNKWFKENCLKLVRITDKEFMLDSDILLSRLYAVQQKNVFVSMYELKAYENNQLRGEI